MKPVLAYILIYLLILTFIINLLITHENNYTRLSQSFLKGHLDILNPPTNTTDLSYYMNRYYWPLGPFPAILIAPFVFIFGTNFNENYFKTLVTIINTLLVFLILRKLKIEEVKAYLITIFFIFGSIYTPVALIPYSTYFAQVIATCLLLLAIYEFLNKRRWLLISFLISLIAFTRSELITSTVFFLAYLLKNLKVKSLVIFLVPIIASLSLIAFYNYLRFNNPFESGFKYLTESQTTNQRRSKGIFSPAHIPLNVYYMLFKTPDLILNDKGRGLNFPYLKPDYYGMSIFFLSPVLFLLFKTNLKEKTVKVSLLATIVYLLPVICFYGIGFRQIGYRYALGALPFLLIVLAFASQKTSLITLAILIFIGTFLSWFFTFELFLGY